MSEECHSEEYVARAELVTIRSEQNLRFVIERR